MTMVEVVGAVLYRDGRVLLTQRPLSMTYPGAWECPCGPVAGLHESNHDALRRTLRDQLAVELTTINEHALWCGEIQTFGTKRYFMLLYAAAFAGEPKPTGEAGSGWFTPSELQALFCTPGNVAARPAICEMVAHNERRADGVEARR